MTSAGAVAVWLAASLAVVSAACAGSGGDKAGGREPVAKPVGKPVVLTLVTGDSLWAPEFAAAAARLSGGAIRIEIRVQRTAQTKYERFTVEDVRRGKAQLGSVGARVWDTMGVTSFRALVAPFLVDSLALQRRVLESPLAARILEGADRAGVVGLAILPGPLRRPLGLSRPLVELRDYEGATIGTRFGGVARATFRALGATSKSYRMGSLSGLDGAELDLHTIAVNGYDVRARRFTANVVLWPRPQTIFINREVFDRLTPAQRGILRAAGREALAPEFARIEKEQEEALSGICARRPDFLVSASISELAALRKAVQPVYDELERDAQTKALIAEIRRMHGRTVEGEPLLCPEASGQAKSDVTQLDGLWRANASREDLLATGVPRDEAERHAGRGTLELNDGRWVARRENGNVWSGIYAVNGDILLLTVTICGPSTICTVGRTHEYTWSVYREMLSLSRVPPGIPFYWGLIGKPLTRVR